MLEFPETSCHVRGISAMAIDSVSGSVMLTGSSGDYMLKIWDLENMNQTMRPFKEFKPFDGHPINKLSFSCDYELFLCCTTRN